jgi:hypothetical protein
MIKNFRDISRILLITAWCFNFISCIIIVGDYWVALEEEQTYR